MGLNLLDDPVVNGFVMNVRDVTELKQTEAELESYRKELEKRVQERTTELAAANARLQVELAERLRAEEALRTSETLHRALVQQSTDIISILDAQGRFVYNSPAMEKILGYPSESLKGQHAFTYLHPEDQQRIQNRFAGVVDGERAGRLTALRMRRSDGTWRFLECRGNNLLDDPGIGDRGHQRDVTEIKKAEEEQRRLEGRLSQAGRRSPRHPARRRGPRPQQCPGVLVGYAELLRQEIPAESPSHRRVTRILQSSLKAARSSRPA